MISGYTPLHLINKPVAGTGGSQLAKVGMLLFQGEPEDSLNYSATNEDEVRKATITAAREGRGYLFFDDVKELNSRYLIRSLTSDNLSDRLLGSNKTISERNRFIWAATGNNVFLGNEMDRRSVLIYLNPRTSNIQGRSFRHDDYEGWVLDNRAELVTALLTLIQHWVAEGANPFIGRSLTTFEDWARQVGGVLQAAGLGHGNRRRAVVDPAIAAARQLVAAWKLRFSLRDVTPAELADYAIGQLLDVVEGRDEEKKKRLYRRFSEMDGTTYTLDGEDYTVTSTVNDRDELIYRLERTRAAG